MKFLTCSNDGVETFGAVIDATGQFADGYLLTGVVVAVGVLVLAFGFREKR